jgi:hypothetical protein
MNDDMDVDAGEAMDEDVQPPPTPPVHQSFQRRGSMSEDEERQRRQYQGHQWYDSILE